LSAIRFSGRKLDLGEPEWVLYLCHLQSLAARTIEAGGFWNFLRLQMGAHIV
jgi:hypothetical protein